MRKTCQYTQVTIETKLFNSVRKLIKKLEKQWQNGNAPGTLKREHLANGAFKKSK